jgi:hypothetical protein
MYEDRPVNLGYDPSTRVVKSADPYSRQMMGVSELEGQVGNNCGHDVITLLTRTFCGLTAGVRNLDILLVIADRVMRGS